MLSERLHAAINEQINAELWSAYLYLSMSMDAEAKGYKGVANWFYVQWLEEQDHARILANYLNSRDAKVELKPIAEVQTEWALPTPPQGSTHLFSIFASPFLLYKWVRP